MFSMNAPDKGKALIFSELFGVTVHDNVDNIYSLNAKNYQLNTYVYIAKTDSWFIRHHDYEILNHIPDWKPIRSKNVPEKFRLMAMVC